MPSPSHRTSPTPRPGRDRGASAVEMALVAPFLLILLLGVVEFGFLFGQSNEMRHAAREGARYAAASNPDLGEGSWNANVVESVCAALELEGASAVTVDVVGPTSGAQPLQQEYATITVSATTQSITGAPMISSMVPGNLSSEAVFRLERDAEWTSPVSGTC